MKILHIIASVNPAHGGPTEGIRQRSRVLEAQGHCVEVASLDDPEAPWVREYPLKTYALGPGKTSYQYSPHLIPWLRAHANEYDYVVVNGLWQFNSLGARIALKTLGKPYFIFTHGMLDPWFKHTYPFKHLKKMLFWPWSEYLTLKMARAVLFTSDEERRLARESFKPYQCHEVVVNYGTSAPAGDPDAQRALFLAQYPEVQGKRMFLYLSRIHVKKGADLLLDAFASVAKMEPSLHLVMAGPDSTELVPKLQAQAEALGIASQITWPGMLSGDMKLGAFHAAEAFVLPSHQENFGIAVAEALSCGVPVLISDKVNIWREIDGDAAGFAAPDTSDGTRQLLERWMALPPAQGTAMRQNARECFMARFEIHQAAKSFLDTLEREAPRTSPAQAALERA